MTGPPGRFLDVHGTPIAGADPDLTANILGADPQTGLNRLYGSAIAGGTGASVVLTEGGQRVRTLATFPGRAGGDVRSTFDLAVQRDGEAVLDPLGPAREAALVAIDTAVRRRVGRPVGGDVPGSAAGRSLIRPGRPGPPVAGPSESYRGSLSSAFSMTSLSAGWIQNWPRATSVTG